MKFEYTGRHIDVTAALKQHVEEHFDKIGHLFEGKTTKAQVIIEVERGRHLAEIIVKWRSEILTATAKSDDMYQSLSQAIGKIEKQALKIKNKVVDKSHKAKRASVRKEADQEVLAEPSNEPRVINARRYAVKPVTIDEAVMTLTDQEDQFLVFRNSENDRVSVIYKRKDGNYGLIQP